MLPLFIPSPVVRCSLDDKSGYQQRSLPGKGPRRGVEQPTIDNIRAANLYSLADQSQPIDKHSL